MPVLVEKSRPPSDPANVRMRTGLPIAHPEAYGAKDKVVNTGDPILGRFILACCSEKKLGRQGE